MNPIAVLPVQSSSSLLTPAALAALSDEEVKDGVTTWAGRIAAGEARLMAYIGELDERRAWAVDGILSCVHWLSWRLGMGPNAAGERVRVARALRNLPAISAAFGEGRLSYSQVRAISRVATPDTETDYIGMARHATGNQLERLVRGVQRARTLRDRRVADKAAAAEGREPEPQRIQLSSRYNEDGDLCITIKAGAADGAVLLAAIEAARTDLSAERIDEPTQQVSAGEGLLQLARAYLNHRAATQPARARKDRSQLIVQLDPRSGWSRLPDGELLPPGCLQLTVHDQGRSARHPSQALRDLLGAVDGERCRYPSCTRRRKLHAHHLLAWQRGGRTDLANLILLCARHHETVIHSEGVRLKLDPVTRTLTVTTADGRPVPHRHDPPWQPAEHPRPQRPHRRRHPPTRRRRQTPPALRRRNPHATSRLELLAAEAPSLTGRPEAVPIRPRPKAPASAMAAAAIRRLALVAHCASMLWAACVKASCGVWVSPGVVIEFMAPDERLVWSPRATDKALSQWPDRLAVGLEKEATLIPARARYEATAARAMAPTVHQRATGGQPASMPARPLERSEMARKTKTGNAIGASSKVNASHPGPERPRRAESKPMKAARASTAQPPTTTATLFPEPPTAAMVHATATAATAMAAMA